MAREEEDGRGARKKKLLILDVNGLLVDTYFTGEDRPSRSCDAVVGRFAVYRRPHCEDFLQFCLRHFYVAVWSSAKEHNVMGLVNFILGESKKLLAFVWGQDWCTDSGVKCLTNKFKPLFLKELRKVWESSKPDVPWDKGDYGPWNTLLIDDSPHKVLRNPDHTAVLALPYSAKVETTAADDFLPTLQTYLEKLIKVPDVRDFVRSNPIGQSMITESSRDWEFYSQLKASVRSSKSERRLKSAGENQDAGSKSKGKAVVESTDSERQPSSSRTQVRRRHETTKYHTETHQRTGYLKRYDEEHKTDHLTRYETRKHDTDQSRKCQEYDRDHYRRHSRKHKENRRSFQRHDMGKSEQYETRNHKRKRQKECREHERGARHEDGSYYKSDRRDRHHSSERHRYKRRRH